MARSYEFSFSSTLAVSAQQAWEHASSLAGVNRELAPLARMTYPAAAAVLTPATVPLKQRLFRSWILLFGVLPVDYDDLTLMELEPGRRFLEHSTMLSQRDWVHERIIEAADQGCRVSDRLRFVPRVALLGPLYLAMFRLTFRLRHRNLVRLFGATGVSP
jgi:hypothetical protein